MSRDEIPFMVCKGLIHGDIRKRRFAERIGICGSKMFHQRTRLLRGNPVQSTTWPAYNARFVVDPLSSMMARLAHDSPPIARQTVLREQFRLSCTTSPSSTSTWIDQMDRMDQMDLSVHTRVAPVHEAFAISFIISLPWPRRS